MNKSATAAATAWRRCIQNLLIDLESDGRDIIIDESMCFIRPQVCRTIESNRFPLSHLPLPRPSHISTMSCEIKKATKHVEQTSNHNNQGTMEKWAYKHEAFRRKTENTNKLKKNIECVSYSNDIDIMRHSYRDVIVHVLCISGYKCRCETEHFDDDLPPVLECILSTKSISMNRFELENWRVATINRMR